MSLNFEYWIDNEFLKRINSKIVSEWKQSLIHSSFRDLCYDTIKLYLVISFFFLIRRGGGFMPISCQWCCVQGKAPPYLLKIKFSLVYIDYRTI